MQIKTFIISIAQIFLSIMLAILTYLSVMIFAPGLMVMVKLCDGLGHADFFEGSSGYFCSGTNLTVKYMVVLLILTLVWFLLIKNISKKILK